MIHDSGSFGSSFSFFASSGFGLKTATLGAGLPLLAGDIIPGGNMTGIELGLGLTPALGRAADGPRLGGAIMAANGSRFGLDSSAGAGVGAETDAGVDAMGVLGGGGKGAATSAGSSPGKTQTFFSSSK